MASPSDVLCDPWRATVAFPGAASSAYAMAEREHDREIAALRRRLAELAEEREALEARLEQLLQPDVAYGSARVPACDVTVVSPAGRKVALFRTLFAGRTDVFPIRWENAKAGRVGYAPACANEWALGICGKPRVKCGACPNQAFIPVSDGVIEGHLRGEDRVRRSRPSTWWKFLGRLRWPSFRPLWVEGGVGRRCLAA